MVGSRAKRIHRFSKDNPPTTVFLAEVNQGNRMNLFKSTEPHFTGAALKACRM